MAEQQALREEPDASRLRLIGLDREHQLMLLGFHPRAFRRQLTEVQKAADLVPEFG